jgi:hypothetical protein
MCDVSGRALLSRIPFLSSFSEYGVIGLVVYLSYYIQYQQRMDFRFRLGAVCRSAQGRARPTGYCEQAP